MGRRSVRQSAPKVKPYGYPIVYEQELYALHSFSTGTARIAGARQSMAPGSGQVLELPVAEVARHDHERDVELARELPR